MTKLAGPVMLLPDISKDATAIEDLLARFNGYGLEVFKKSDGKTQFLNIVAAGFPDNFLKTNFSKYPYLKIKVLSNNRIIFLMQLRTLVFENRKEISMLIAGDPWLGFLWSQIATFGLKIPIQVSIHGEPYLPINYLRSTKPFLKHVWLRCFLNFADSIRLVSEHQMESIINVYQIDSSKISIAPIPVKIPDGKITAKEYDHIVAFVGRLHSERGINLWIDVIGHLYTKRQDFSVVIVGDGPERENFLNRLSSSCSGLSIEFLGRITHDEVAKLWSNISVLLSTAHTESYGLTLREAQMSGTFVVAFQNEGTRSNSSLFPKGMALFTTIEQAAEAISSNLDSHISPSRQLEFRRIQKALNLSSMNNLISSWRLPKY